MSYRQDSDLYVPYGRFVKKSEIPVPEPSSIWAFTPNVKGKPLPYSFHIPDPEEMKWA